MVPNVSPLDDGGCGWICLIEGSATPHGVASALAEVARRSGRELNPIIVSPADATRRFREQDHFITSVLARPRIWLLGDDISLAALA
ncbi:MAG TPA: hypothetical protein VFH61_12110 [Thermoleophilia bacterium]|nr:hypothetical protein [Thermoleophilia bacterium]